jgi:uncharacterized protein YaiE (UPF0345 family)
MLRNLSFALLVIVVSACNNSTKKNDKNSERDTAKPKSETTINVLTDEQKADGWQLLFDGQSTAGWHKYGGAPVGSSWKVIDGALHLDVTDKESWQAKGGGDIVSEKEYKNFHLKLEWKIDTCGNSGIMFYVHEDSSKYKFPWETGPEMQVLDNSCHPDAKIIKHRAGDLYDIITSSPETVKPALEWNQAEIKCVNGALEFYLNGTKVLNTVLWDNAWKEALKSTKWKDYKDFGTYNTGRIALQDHGNNVWYRNIMIKEL